MDNCRGFSLIEVLVTIVLVTVGVLGTVALQGKSIQYTQDAMNRNAAINLAHELIEIMRAHQEDLFRNKPLHSAVYKGLRDTTDIYQADGRLKLNTEACPSLSLAQNLIQQANCWFKQVEATLPDASALMDSFLVCPSYKLDNSGQPVCAGSSYKGSSLAVQLAWRSKELVCGKNSDSDICTFTTRLEL